MRHPDWPGRLDAVVSAAARRRFRYGDFDCCLFAADVVNAITGVDRAAELRGYRSRRQALVILERAGGFVPLVTRLLGPAIPAAQAGRGDVIFGYPIVDGAVGVCLGRSVAFAGPKGVSFYPRSVAALAWRI